MISWPALCAQLAIASAIGAGLFAACRWLRRRSDLCGRLVVAGLLIRATAMLALFWTSFLNPPFLRNLHSGDGFWTLAIDARTYYHWAFNGALNGLDTMPATTPSPVFVKGLALWMMAVGSSPVSGPYFNLVLYVLLCVLIVASFKPAGTWRDDLPCAVMVAAVSFSPVLILQSSQPLKDTLFMFVLAIVCLAVCAFLPPLVYKDRAARGSIGKGLTSAAAFLLAVYAIAGLRAYYDVLALSALALVLFVFAWRQRPVRFLGYTAVSVLFLTASWLAYAAGAGTEYINPYDGTVATAWATTKPVKPASGMPGAISEAAGSVLHVIDSSRTGFVSTPGATNVKPRAAAPVADNRPSPVTTAAPTPVTAPVAPVAPASAPPVEDAGLSDRLSAVALGLQLVFVPVSVLRALSLVDFPGGRGLLAITDADTLFMDLAIAAVFTVLVRRRSAIREGLPYLCFAATLAVAAAVLMAYVVVNFGTLFRLRLMVAVPLWLLPLALSTRPIERLERPAPESRRRAGLLDLLVCPACGGRLEARDEDVHEVLRCAGCGLAVPIRAGIPRFVEAVRDRPSDPIARLAVRTQASFGYEWTHFHAWNDSGETNFRDYFETADLSRLRDGLVLDAGCGMGRSTRLMAAHARHVIAVDFSRAIEQAAANTRGIANVDCVQADLLRLPFPDRTFDYIYSLGVLHHLGNTETAVRALVGKLKPGGRLRVYLYWKRHGWVGAVLRFVSAARSITTRLPFWLLRWFCWALSVVLWGVLILPYRLLVSAGVRGMSDWPLFVYSKYPFRILYNDQFDRFSAPLEKRYDPDEVTALLESAGLRDVRVEARFGWIAEGARPE